MQTINNSEAKVKGFKSACFRWLNRWTNLSNSLKSKSFLSENQGIKIRLKAGGFVYKV